MKRAVLSGSTFSNRTLKPFAEMDTNYDKYGRKYYLTHRSEILARQKNRTSQPKIKAHIKRYHQGWYRKNRARIIQYQLASHSHPEYRALKQEYDGARYRRIREKKLKQNKRWRDSHLEEQSMFSRRRRVRKLFLGGHHSVDEWLMVKALFGNACANCGIPEVLRPLHQDHKIPLAQGGTDNIDNIQPLCQSCNSSKGTRIWFACRPVDKSWPNIKFSMFQLSGQKAFG